MDARFNFMNRDSRAAKLASNRRKRLAKKPIRQEIRTFAKAAYQQAILDAAEGVFSRLGYHAAKMSDVATAAGVSIGTLYNHFASKDQIFGSLVERGTAQIREAAREAAATEDPEERLRALVHITFAFLEERGALFSVFVQLGALSETHITRVAGKHGEQAYVEYIRLLEHTLGEFAAKGRIRRDVAPHALAVALSGSMNGAIFDWVRSGRTESLEDRADALLDLFLQGAIAR